MDKFDVSLNFLEKGLSDYVRNKSERIKTKE